MMWKYLSRLWNNTIEFIFIASGDWR